MLFLNVGRDEELHPGAPSGARLLKAFLSSQPLQHCIPHLAVAPATSTVPVIDYAKAMCVSTTFVTYIVDWQWLVPLVPDSAASSITVCANWVPETADTEEPIAKFREGSKTVRVGDREVTVVHPVQDTGLMHAKLFVLDFGTFVRVVIGTANLTLDDFINMGQGFWTVDVPSRSLRTGGEAPAIDSSFSAGIETFGGQLASVLRVLDLHDCADRCEQCDFSAVSARLVLSLPKSHVCASSARDRLNNVHQGVQYHFAGEDDEEDEEEEEAEEVIAPEWKDRLGIDSLAEAVTWVRSALPPAVVDELDTSGVPVWYQASSVGGITDDILVRMERACGPTAPSMFALFPSTTAVQSQLQHGRFGAIALRCFQSGAGLLPTSRWMDFASMNRPFHTKLIMHATPSSAEGWVYLGSHNFTSDSWCFTRRTVPGVSADPRNIELGVVVPITAAGSGPQQHHPQQLAGLREVLPDPFWIPAGAPVSPFATAFVFLRDRAMIKAAGEADGAAAARSFTAADGEERSHFAMYHWRKFQAEYANPFGRH